MSDSYWDSKSDPYVYPGTQVLKNLANIEDGEKLQAFEEQVTALRLEEAMAAIKGAPINLKTWQKLHKILFQDVYEWSGEIRSVHLAKGNTVFALPQTIETQAREIFDNMEKENIQALPKDAFVSRMAYYFSELNVLHPFREGNGRTQKLFFDEIIHSAGYEIDWSQIGTDDFLDAIVHAYESQDHSKLELIFQQTLTQAPL